MMGANGFACGQTDAAEKSRQSRCEDAAEMEICDFLRAIDLHQYVDMFTVEELTVAILQDMVL